MTLSRRTFLKGGTAALAFTGMATGAGAQESRLQAHIANSVNSFNQVIRHSSVSNTLIKTLEFTLSNRQAFPDDRLAASGVLGTLQTIKDGRFNQLNQNEQLDVMRCTLQNTAGFLNYAYNVAKGRDNAAGTAQTRNEVRAMRQNYNIIRGANNALDPFFRGRSETCASVWGRTIGNVRYTP